MCTCSILGKKLRSCHGDEFSESYLKLWEIFFRHVLLFAFYFVKYVPLLGCGMVCLYKVTCGGFSKISCSSFWYISLVSALALTSLKILLGLWVIDLAIPTITEKVFLNYLSHTNAKMCLRGMTFDVCISKSG